MYRCGAPCNVVPLLAAGGDDEAPCGFTDGDVDCATAYAAISASALSRATARATTDASLKATHVELQAMRETGERLRAALEESQHQLEAAHEVRPPPPAFTFEVLHELQIVLAS